MCRWHSCCAIVLDSVRLKAELTTGLSFFSSFSQHIPVESLIKQHYDTSVEFLQWFRFFYNSNGKDDGNVKEASRDQQVSSKPGWSRLEC